MQFRKSVMMTTMAEPKLKGLKELCAPKKISLEKMSNIQFQSAYAMQGFKAIHQVKNKKCFIFISYASEDKFNIAAYYEGLKIAHHQFKSKQELVHIIEDSLIRSPSQSAKSAQEQSLKIEKLFENLNKKSESILKKSTNEMIAVQQIKGSEQYMKICNQIKVLSLEIKELCKIISARSDKCQIKDEELLNKLGEVEQKKSTLQDIQFNYQVLKQKADNIDQIIDVCLEKRKKELSQHSKFYDEHSFLRYLQALIAVKEIENQKKFLKKNEKSGIY